jgi:hypothetical protein
MAVIGDKLTLDATVWTGVYWWRAEQVGLAQNRSAFERPGALAGLTGHLSPFVSLRMSGDVSYLQPQDLYVDLRWSSGFGLRAGQFLLPLGMDAMTEPDSQVLAASSFMVSYAKPAGTRDVGVLGSWELRRLSASAAVVNGKGANADDNNNRMDLCGRVTVRPLVNLDAVLALRAYYGRPDAADSVWQSAAFEARVSHGPLTLQAEFQNYHSQRAQNNTAYLQAVWNTGLLEYVGRFDLDLPQGKRTHWMIDGGVNLQPLSDHLKVMFDCSYNRDYQGNWGVFGFSLRLQAGM